MKPSRELLVLIERLYTTFSGYPLSQNTYACPCCTTAEQEGKLHSKPLRELHPDDLTHYAWDALLTWGNESTFKHFLPRLFELFLTIPNPSLHLADTEILFSKFRHGHWREWPEFEQDTIRDFTHCFWNDVLNSELQYDKELGYDNNAWETDTCLCSVGQTGGMEES